MPVWHDEYEYWERLGRFHFIPNRAKLLHVDDAYDVPQDVLDRLQAFNETIGRFTRHGKSQINKRLNKCWKDAEKEAKKLYEDWLEYLDTKYNQDPEFTVYKKWHRDMPVDLKNIDPEIAWKVIRHRLVYPNEPLFHPNPPGGEQYTEPFIGERASRNIQRDSPTHHLVVDTFC